MFPLQVSELLFAADDDNTGTGAVDQSPEIGPNDFVVLCVGGDT